MGKRLTITLNDEKAREGKGIRYRAPGGSKRKDRFSPESGSWAEGERTAEKRRKQNSSTYGSSDAILLTIEEDMIDTVE